MLKQKIKIDNFTGKNIILYCGKGTDEEPSDYIYLESQESKNVEIDPLWDRIAINNSSDTKVSVGSVVNGVSQEDFDKVVSYVRDAVWTKKENH